MESNYLVRFDPNESTETHMMIPDNRYLDVAEFYCDTIQGEGASAGVPAAFLRLQGCTLNCQWCDTQWQKGHRIGFDELFGIMSDNYMADRFRMGQRLIVTGGSPLKQDERLVRFLHELSDKYGMWITTEIENECVLMPSLNLIKRVHQWNNSPKLQNSGMKERARYKPTIIKKMAELQNSWFKFVIGSESDLDEINNFFIIPDLINRSQVILMPLAGTLQELEANRDMVVDLAIKYGVRYSSREQLVLNKP